jgi:hypothetical protein
MVDLLLVVLYITLFAAVVLTLWSAVRSIRMRGPFRQVVNNIPATRIACAAALLLAVTMLLTFLLGSSSPMLINGTKYSQTFWLKASDMFINTAALLTAVAVIGVIFGVSGFNRKLKR